MHNLIKTVFSVALITSCIYANANVAGVNIIFNQFNQEDSMNCPANIQTALLEKPITATVIVSQNQFSNLGFADLLLTPPTFNTSAAGYAPQITLTNMGISHQFDLLGEGLTDSTGTNYVVTVATSSVPLYVQTISLINVTPSSGSSGMAYLYVSTSPAKSSSVKCALQGQIVNSTVLPPND